MKIQGIVAAAGSGERLGGTVPKPFVLIHGRPLVIYTLLIFEKCPLMTSVIVAAHPDHLDQMRGVISDAGLKKISHVVAGGKERSQSIKKALAFLDDDTDRVLIHDGARPLVTPAFVQEMMVASIDDEALIAAVPVKPTIKRVDPVSCCVEETLDRRCLWDIQTPQIFARELLVQAYNQETIDATDDASLVERLGQKVKIFPGLEQNIKVTTPYDLLLVHNLLREA